LLKRPSRDRVRLRWHGFGSIEQLAACLERRRPVTIDLPWSFHHVLCARLSPRATAHGSLRVQGGTELLSELAAIPGLHDFADVADSVHASDAEVRVYSPSPRVSITFK
jgi:hypothetical protein